MMNGFGGHGWGMGMGWWWIIGIVILLVIIWMVVKGKSRPNIPSNQPDSKSALDILKERYAKGEIDKQEFKNAKRVYRSFPLKPIFGRKKKEEKQTHSSQKNSRK